MYQRCAAIVTMFLAVAAAAARGPGGGLKCQVNGTSNAAAAASDCSFCVTFNNQMDGTRLLLCAARLEAAASTEASADAQLGASAVLDVAQLELLASRRIARRCLGACGGGGGGGGSGSCVYAEATLHNITDASGALIDTVLLGNATYYCCREAHFCNTAEISASPALASASASATGSGHLGSVPGPSLWLLAVLHAVSWRLIDGSWLRLA